MTREDITRMALEAGLGPFEMNCALAHVEDLERFAALVAAAEREKVAKWQIGSGYSTGHGETIEDLLVELEWQVRESEREVCAKVCIEQSVRWYTDQRDVYVAHECAAAIRARGQA